MSEPGVGLAIAHWESKEKRDAKDDRSSRIVADILDKHKAMCDIEIVGEFDDAEWSVLPETNS